jgi:glycogen debranching enzyme
MNLLHRYRRPAASRKQSGLFSALVIALTSVVVYAFWRVQRFTRRLLHQPPFQSDYVLINVNEETEILAHAYDITVNNLRGGIETRYMGDGVEKLVLCAGRRNFREPWARDFGFASYGLLAIQEDQVVKECLELFLYFQRPSGQFPVKIHSTSVLDRYIHSLLRREQPIYKPLRPKYVTAHNTISLDGNCLLVIACLRYARQTGDTAFVKANWNQLRQALHWLDEHTNLEDGLLNQAPFTDWADSVGRTGRILYTNVLYWKALQEMSAFAQQNGLADDLRCCSDKAYNVRQALQHQFWREDLGYFITSEQHDMLSSSGNLMAIVWNLATPEQAHSILDRMNEFGMADPVPTRVTHREYPETLIALENRLAGIPEYHTHAAWLWLGAWHIIALTRMKRQEEAETLLHRAAQVIARDGVVHEVYGRDSYPLSTFWYTSEAPLTWNAGMLVFAYHEATSSQQEEI